MSQRKHIPSLDGLRGLAILLVLATHLLKLSSDNIIIEGSNRLFGIGWIGVDLFFVLSGFLIAGILLDEREEPKYFRRFYARRTLRIFPLYYFSVAIVIFVFPFLYSEELQGLLLLEKSQIWYWLYLTNFGVVFDLGRWTPFATGHFWSLAVEEQFYLFWPLVVFYLGRRKLKFFCLSILICSPFLRFLSLYFLSESWGDSGVQMGAICNYILTPLRLDGFAMGTLIAAAIRAPAPEWIVRNYKLLGPAATFPLFCYLLINKLQFYWGDPLISLIGFSLLAVSFGCLLLACLYSAVVAKVFENRVLRFFGKYSYAMYIVHYPVWFILDEKFINFPQHLKFWDSLVLLIASFALTIVLSLASWHLLEKHFLGLKKYF